MKEHSGHELKLRRRFLIESRERLTVRLQRLKAEFQTEVLRVSAEIATARDLRGERLAASKELRATAKDERDEMSRPAKERLIEMGREESEAVKELTYLAVGNPAKGKKLRGLLAETEAVERRLREIDGEISQLDRLIR